jgi:hypothetical protein
MRKFKNIFPVFILAIFLCFAFFIISCDNYKSEEFEISALDSKACQQLKSADSLGVDTVTVRSLASFDSTIAVDTMLYNLDSVLVDTTIYLTWTDEIIYDTLTWQLKSKYISPILETLIANNLTVTNTAENKIKLITLGTADTNYVALQSSSSSLTFFFDQSVTINLINGDGAVTTVSDKTMPLETAAGCTKLNAQDIEVPLIQARYTIGVPSNPALLQVIKNEQTELRTIHMSIL